MEVTILIVGKKASGVEHEKEIFVDGFELL